MPRLTRDQRNQAIGQLQNGASLRHVANQMGCTCSTILRLRNRYQQIGSVEDRPRPGRERATTHAQDQELVDEHLADRFRPATQSARDLEISSSTVRRRLATAGLQAHRPFVGPLLTAQHRLRRLQWAQEHRHWTPARWRSVLFTDESRFSLHAADGRARVWRRRGERMAEACVQQTDQWGTRSVMVWGGMSRDFRTQLHIFHGHITAEVYRNDVIENIVIPFFRNHGNVTILQQDNATPHTARLTRDYLEQQRVQTLPWASLSSDLSPIEHLWDELGRRVKRFHNPQNVAQLEAALIQEWENIPQDRLRRLVGSMRARCDAVIAAQGGHTRY